MADDITWYSVYQGDMDDGTFDADYTPHNTRESAIEEATTYLNFATGDSAEVFVLPIPSEWYENHDDTDEPWSLWDDMGKVDDEEYVWLKRDTTTPE